MIKMIAVVVAMASGCAATMQARPTAQASECTTGSRLWIADAAIAGAGAATAGIGIGVGLTDSSDAWRAAAGVGLVTAIVYYASADNGRRWARECRARTAERVAAGSVVTAD